MKEHSEEVRQMLDATVYGTAILGIKQLLDPQQYEQMPQWLREQALAQAQQAGLIVDGIIQLDNIALQLVFPSLRGKI